MKTYIKFYIYSPIYLLLLTLLSLSANSAEYWVSKTGNDSNQCSITEACLTIQRGVSLLSAGDVLNITAGTYSDDGGNSPYKPPGTFCAWLDSTPSSSSVCIDIDGTKENPIIIQAAPGNEGKVTIDSQGLRIGIHLQNSDYIQIRGLKLINSATIGIASWGQPQNTVADQSSLSIGVVIENNEIDTVRGGTGINTSGVGMWGSKDWIVRNNRIKNITVASGTNASCIQAYGTINALIENNHLTNAVYGVYWKDHFVKDLETRTPLFESEIRYNLIHDITSRGIYIGIMGSKTPESGINYIHHNIIYNYVSAGVSVGTGGAYTISGPIQIDHNLLDGSGASGSGISIDSASEIDISSNIFLRNRYSLEFITYADPIKRPFLKSSNYNFYTPDVNIITGRYSSSSQTFTNLANWQSNAYSAFTSLTSTSTIETNSLTGGYDNKFTSLASRDYHYQTDSFKLKPDGTSIGPYQTGSEVIGLKAGWPSYTNKAAPPPNIQSRKFLPQPL